MNVSPEMTLILALWVIYLAGCVRWVAPGEVAFVRGAGDEWVRKGIEAGSYTLLGRMPVVRNPLSTGAGLVVLKADAVKAGLVSVKMLGLRHRVGILRWVCAMSGVYLLVVVPVMIEMGMLTRWWKVMAAVLLALHGLVIVEFVSAAGLWWRRDKQGFVAAVLALAFNPVGAVRAADVVGGWRVGMVVRPR